jgi:hypothetical protein
MSKVGGGGGWRARRSEQSHPLFRSTPQQKMLGSMLYLQSIISF